MAGTTLVGQSIGAGDRSWARQIGNSLIVVCMTYMTITGVAVALCGRPLTAFFIEAADPLAPHVIALGAVILWIAAAYQSFDGLNLAASFCLRGAGDAFVPAMLVLVLSWLLFIPLAHMLTYERGQGWVEGLPQFGLGAIGGWIAAVVYIAALGLAMLMRWRSRAWEGLRVG
jgi:MATE family multidrug resistance protein